MSRYKPIHNTNTVTYVKTNINTNKANMYSNRLVVSESDRLNDTLIKDYKKLLNNSCIYLPNFLCSLNDLIYFDKLKEEITMRNLNIVNWSAHYKLENPSGIKIFEEIVDKVSKTLQVKVKATRINYYANGTDWKPYHRDSHKTVDGEREDITIGISIGASRELSFLHVASNKKFSFPQNNGDLFAFTDIVNESFKHGVPKTKATIGERFSIIIWGKQMIDMKDQQLKSKLE
jgi:hypothetical protein